MIPVLVLLSHHATRTQVAYLKSDFAFLQIWSTLLWSAYFDLKDAIKGYFTIRTKKNVCKNDTIYFK